MKMRSLPSPSEMNRPAAVRLTPGSWRRPSLHGRFRLLSQFAFLTEDPCGFGGAVRVRHGDLSALYHKCLPTGVKFLTSTAANLLLKLCSTTHPSFLLVTDEVCWRNSPCLLLASGTICWMITFSCQIWIIYLLTLCEDKNHDKVSIKVSPPELLLLNCNCQRAYYYRQKNNCADLVS